MLAATSGIRVTLVSSSQHTVVDDFYFFANRGLRSEARWRRPSVEYCSVSGWLTSRLGYSRALNYLPVDDHCQLLIALLVDL